MSELVEPKIEPEEVESEPVKPGVICGECFSSFPSNYALQEHINVIHKRLKEHTCDVCSKSFGRKSGLVKHMKFVHPKSFKCKECVVTPCEHDLKIVHGNSKRFPCDLCSSTFKRKYDLSAHKKYVHEKEKPFLCPFCAKEIARKADLETHIRLVHDMLKPYYCDQCGKSFGTLPNLRTHIKDVHVKIASIPCPKCDKVFISNQRQRDHIKYVHDKVREHQCDFCDKRLETKFKKARHIRQVHEKSRNFECPNCDKGYTKESDLETHLQMAHVRGPESDLGDLYETHEINYFNQDDGDGAEGDVPEEITIEPASIFIKDEMDHTDSTGDGSASDVDESNAHTMDSEEVDETKDSFKIYQSKPKPNSSANYSRHKPTTNKNKIKVSPVKKVVSKISYDSERARFVHHQGSSSTEGTPVTKSETSSNILEVYSTTHSKEPITDAEWSKIEEFLIDHLTDEISSGAINPLQVKTSRSGHDKTKKCGVIMVKDAESKAWYQTSVSKFSIAGKTFRVWSMDEVPEVYQVKLILPGRLNRIDKKTVMKLLLSFNPQLNKLMLKVCKVEESKNEGRVFVLQVCRDTFEILKHKDWKLDFVMGEVECTVD